MHRSYYGRKYMQPYAMRGMRAMYGGPYMRGMRAMYGGPYMRSMRAMYGMRGMRGMRGMDGYGMDGSRSMYDTDDMY